MLEPAARIGPYELVAGLGHGNQAEVWEAEDRNGSRFAIKVLFDTGHADHPVLVERERWEREVTLTAALRHPCLPSLVDSGEHDGRMWLASTLIRGQALAMRYEYSRPSDPFEFTAVLVCVCAALDALHHVPLADAVGAVHRDVKPANIVMNGYGTEAFAWVVDLGTAKPRDGSTTRPVGSLEYLAPEQVEGAEPSPKVDVWATAAVAMWLLTGEAPIPKDAAETESEYLRRRAKNGEHPIAVNRGSVPPWAHLLLPAIERALHPDPNERPGALELASDLASVTWPDGAPPRIAPLLAGFGLHSVETTAFEQHPDRGDPTAGTLDLPRAGLLDLLARLRPGHHDRALWRAIALLRSRAEGGSAAAEAAWRRAEAAGDPAALARAARELEEREGWHSAADLWQKADAKGSPAAALRLARQALADGDRESGLGLLRRAAERGHPEAAWELHKELASEDDRGEATTALKAAIALGHPPALLSAGQTAYDVGHISEGERLWQAAADRGDEAAALRLSELHRERGDFDRARECLDDHSGAEVEFARGSALHGLGDYDEATKHLSRARQLGDARAPGLLGSIALDRKDWAAAEQHWRTAAEMGNREKLLGLGAALHKRGNRYEAELVYRSVDDSLERTVLLAALQFDRGDHSAACATLDEAIVREETAPLRWSLDFARPQLEELAHTHRVAALYNAHRLRFEDAAGKDEESRRVRALDAYRHAAALGSVAAQEWAAHWEPDAEIRRNLLEDLAKEDRNGWASYAYAKILVGDGRSDDAVAWLRRSAELGLLEATTHDALLNAVDDDEHERLLRLADGRGSADGAALLGEWLQGRLGARHQEVEAAHSRADLRGSAPGAVNLGLVRDAQEGPTQQVVVTYRRAERRGSSAGAFNLGSVYEVRGDLRRAEEQYRRSIDMGLASGYIALAWLEAAQGHHVHALEMAEEADKREPTWRSALCLGDLRLKAGNRFGAIEAYRRADALGNERACVELAYLWADDEDVEPALKRAERRIGDDTSPLWNLTRPKSRAVLMARIRALREWRQHEREQSASTRRPSNGTRRLDVRVHWLGH